MKIILIARVSDVEQRKALPAQKLKLEAYAKAKDMPYEYYEFDESAHTDVRRQFAKLVDNIKAQKEQRCIVAFDKIDRFTRDSSQEEVKALNNLVRQDKIELHFPSDNLYITKNSPASDLFRLGIGMALAKYYSDSIRDNVIRRFDQLLNARSSHLKHLNNVRCSAIVYDYIFHWLFSRTKVNISITDRCVTWPYFIVEQLVETPYDVISYGIGIVFSECHADA